MNVKYNNLYNYFNRNDDNVLQEYEIRVQRGPVPENSWTVTKRYSDFVALDTALKMSAIELPLPPKKVFGNMEREFIAERQTGLQVDRCNGFLN